MTPWDSKKSVFVSPSPNFALPLSAESKPKKETMNSILAVIIILVVSVALLAVRLICGKKEFVSSDIDDNEPLKKKGIDCPMKQDRMARKNKGFAIKEHE